MSTCWLRQKQLAFNASYIDYITCTQFVVLPNDDNENNNQNSKFTEVLYIGCNNGSVIACDVSSLPPADNNNDNNNAKNKKMDVGSHLFLLYRHQQGGVDTRGSNNRMKSKTTATSGSGGGLFDDNDNNNKNIINDEVSGCSVFALCQYETLFASCGDDKRCVLSMMPESHPPFFLSNNKIRKEEILRKRITSKALVDDRNQNEKLESLAAICPIQDLQPPLVAVIEEASPVRCVQLFGGRKTWVDEFPEDEASTVYCATGGEDGYLRVYRVDVSGCGDSENNNTENNNNNNGNPLSFSYWQKKTSRAVELLWVVSMSAGTASMGGSSSNHNLLLSSHSSSSNKTNNKMISFKHSTLDDDVLELTASSSSSSATSNNTSESSSDAASRHHPFICSLLFDEDTEMFLVGTQSGVCLCDCLPKTNPKYFRGKHERDLGRKATNESWMNSSVWALSEHELKSMSATATATSVEEQQHSSSSLLLPPMPLRSIKSKFLNLYHSARSIGTVVEVLAAETNQADQQQKEENDSRNNDGNKNLAMMKVMFPSISGSKKKSEAATSDHCVILPQHAIRRVCRPRYFLTTSGGPYFAMSIVKNKNNNNNKKEANQNNVSSSSSALTCAIAGAASNGEVLLVRISTTDENSSNSSGSTLNGDVTISLLCRFRAGKDLIKSIVCLNSSSSSSSISLLCGSYDGTMSEWLLARDDENNKQQKEQKEQEEEGLMIPIRRCVQLVESIDGKKEESSNVIDNNKTVSAANLVKYRNLLSSFENNNQSHGKNCGEDTTSSSSSSGVGTLHFFPGAGVLFSSCLFERSMQTFILGLKDGPFELPRGLIFNGYKTVRVDEDENDGGDCDERETGVPEVLLNEGRELEKDATKNKKR